MPELAEVETLKSYLERHLIGKRIVSYKQNRDQLRYGLEKNLQKNIEGASILSVSRRAKYLFMHLDNEVSTTVHLGMSGRFTVKKQAEPPAKHDHIEMGLDDGNRLVLNDARRFGMFYSCLTRDVMQQGFLTHLGPEPLTDDFNSSYCKEKLKGRKSPIKNVLMDNRIVVGVGNIYAAESLFDSGIDPRRPAGSLSSKEIELLVAAVKDVLSRAIEAGGTTLRDFVSGNNEPGYFKQELNVYGRAGLPCPKCSNIIKQSKQGGRTSFYCSVCQD